MAVSLTQRINQAIAMLFGGGVQLSNRNGFVDGTFAYWQANAANPATLSTTAGYVGPVMWKAGAGTGGAGTIGQVDFRTSTDLALLEAPLSFTGVKMSITGGSSGTVAARTAARIWQSLESVSSYAGKSITLSFKLKVDSGNMVIPAVLCDQFFGTGGSPSTSVILDKTVNWNVTTTLKKFSVRVDVPAINGKTLGTSGDTFEAGLWLPPGVTGNLTISEAQIEECSLNSSADTTGAGGSPTSYENRGPQAELARVNRHYWSIAASTGLDLGIAGFAYATNTIHVSGTFQTMRAPPNMAFSLIGCYGPSGSIIGANSVSSVVSTVQSYQASFTMASSAWTAGQGTAVVSNSASAFISADARL